MIRVELDLGTVPQTFLRLQRAGANLKPLMEDIGELLTERTKQRFETSTGPDGKRWATNSQTTFLRLLARYKGSYGKTGKLTAKGGARVAGKKPLIGETKALSTTINYRAGATFVEIGSPMVYAAVHQFGAKARSFTGGKTPWGDIPARPFLGLSVQDLADIDDLGGNYLDQAIRGT
jgi:phage virion morphogenesis protein